MNFGSLLMTSLTLAVIGGAGTPAPRHHGGPAAAKSSVDPPVACNLEALDAAERSRHAELLARLDLPSRERRPCADGWAFELGRGSETLALVAEWVPLEARCCPFLTFDVRWDARDGTRLTLSGGPEVKRFLDATLAR